MAAEVTEAHSAGGRLSVSREGALLAVALDLLAEVGYDRMSLDEVARRAHTSKATLYRRWPGKADLVVAALMAHKTHAQQPPPAATLREDLVTIVTCRCMESSAASSLAQGLLTALRTDARLRELVTTQSTAVMRQDFAAIVDRAVERGELPPYTRARATTIAELVQALIVNRLLINGTPIDPAFIDQIVDAMLLPILRAA